MGKSSKKMKKVHRRDVSSDDDDHNIAYQNVDNEKYGIEYNQTNGDEISDDEEEYESEMETMNLENEEDVSGNEDSDSMGDDDDDDDVDMKTADIEKEINDLRHQEQDLFRNIRRDPNEDLQKGEGVKNQMALWDKTLEFRFLLQKSFVNSNRLPQEPIRSAFCNSGEGVKEAYSDLIDSSKKTLDSILKLQEALIEKNPSIMEASKGNAAKNSTSLDASRKGDEEWFQISQMQSRMAPFRDMSVNKWQRKTQVTSGVAGIKNKFQAFNQNISEQVAFYMRDPSRMMKGMQQRRSVVTVFGNVPNSSLDDEVINDDGDPELLDDSEFYQQLLREFFETIDPESEKAACIALKRLQAQQPAFYALKSLQTKKRKIVDRRASKSRKIRYHIHEKIVNFVAPEPLKMPPMAPKLFENLFGLKNHKLASVY